MGKNHQLNSRSGVYTGSIIILVNKETTIPRKTCFLRTWKITFRNAETLHPSPSFWFSTLSSAKRSWKCHFFRWSQITSWFLLSGLLHHSLEMWGISDADGWGHETRKPFHICWKLGCLLQMREKNTCIYTFIYTYVVCGYTYIYAYKCTCNLSLYI